MDQVASLLHIPREHSRPLSRTRCVCLVTEDWLLNTLRLGSLPGSWKQTLSIPECEQFLAPSNAQLPSPWIRISVKAINDSSQIVDSLPDGPLYSTDQGTSLLGHLEQVGRENFHNLWSEAHVKYGKPFGKTQTVNHRKFAEVLQKYIQRLHPNIMSCLEKQKNSLHNEDYTADTDIVPNIIPILSVIETNKCLLVIQPYISHSLYDIVSYSPAIFSSSHAKPLFILYQVLHAMSAFHEKGLSAGRLNFHSILLDEKLWVYLSNPDTSIVKCRHESLSENKEIGQSKEQKSLECQDGRLSSIRQSESENFVHEARTFLGSCQYSNYEIKDLPCLVEDWVHRKITNFKYLMILNHLAGRRLGDPNHHPVIPWVMDFSGPDYGYRDLSLSKFRLNKGDNQLDLTYESFLDLMDSTHVPHHVTDFLSDITYYVYKARRTAKSILCSHVRSKWVPNEYPTSMQRMQEWTPDECIPEFFTDATIFTSIHEDLPDIELPPWSKNAEDFITKHMAVLESEQVSEMLHHWIDLTFGYKLIGSAAVRAKNVNFHLVDDHKHIKNTGVTQLFKDPHPHRLSQQLSDLYTPRIPKNMLHSQMEVLCSSAFPESGDFQTVQSAFKMLGDTVEETGFSGDKRLVTATTGVSIQRPENATIRLPKSYDPTAELDQLESLYNFTSKTYKGLPPSHMSKTVSPVEDVVTPIITEDMVSFGCLMCEMFMLPSLNTQLHETTLKQRYYSICKACVENRTALPRPIQRAAKSLLHLTANLPKKDALDSCVFKYSAVNKDGLPPPTPPQLLLPHVDLLPFPEYFPELYTCLCDLKQKDSEIDKIRLKGRTNSVENLKLIKVLSRDKVNILQNFLESFQGRLEQEGVELVLPYIEELFEKKDTSVQAAWSLFNLIGQEIGPIETKKRFISFLIKLFNDENPTPKHMKLYSKSFIVQLLLRLGLNPFLSYFSTLLVEAVSGFKDYTFEDFIEQPDSISLSEFENGAKMNDKYLPALQEENVKDDMYESQESDFTNISSDMKKDMEITESTQDDIDEIDEESVDDLPYTGDDVENDPDQVSNKSQTSLSNESEDENGISSNGDGESDDDDDKNISSKDDDDDTKSIHSVSHLIPREQSESVDDRPVWAERQDTLTDTDDLQFEDENGESEQEDLSSATGSELNPTLSQTKKFVKLVSSNMVRSETDEFAQSVSEKSASEVVNIHDIAADSIKWLSYRLGPLLSAKYLSRNLVRMLALCYLGDEQLLSIGDPDKKLPKTSRLVCGDKNAYKILDCLSFIAQLYGEQVILLQYFPCIVDIVNLAKKRLTQRAESSLIGSLVLLRHVVPLLTDKTLMDILQDTIISEILTPVIKLVSSSSYNFPGGSTVRTVTCHKLIDVTYIIGLRIGFEMTRNHMTSLMNDFFFCFNQIHGGQLQRQQSETMDPKKLYNFQGSTDESYCNIKMDSTTQEYHIGTPVSVNSLIVSPTLNSGSSYSPYRSRKSPFSLSSNLPIDDRDESPESTRDRENILEELVEVFNPELAMASYIPFNRIFGSFHMEQCLPDDDLIRKLCAQYDCTMDRASESDSDPTSPVQEEMSPFGNSAGINVSITGNKIQLPQDNIGTFGSPDIIKYGPISRNSRILKIDPDETRSLKLEDHKKRHLKGNWLAYWEHELGLSERDTLFNFKQIKLQTFEGHSNSIRSIVVLDNENSFISASKDRTVKLWSIKSFGDGTGKTKCQWSYSGHKKSVFSAVYLDSVRLVASCDSTVHIWDPFTADVVRTLDSTKHSPVTAMSPLPSPSPVIITANSDANLRFLDMRAGNYTHEFKTSVGSSGLIRCIAVSPDNNWIVVGFSSGIISILDCRTGVLMGTWKGHEGEILQIKPYNKATFISSSFDQTMKLWNAEDVKDTFTFRGQTEPVHCICFYKNQVLSATTGNKIGVHSSVDNQAHFSCTKLRSDTFKGVLTSMAVLPMNKTLLLGADNGSIRLLC